MSKILLVEDDKVLNKGIKLALEKDGHLVIQTYSYLEAINATAREKSFELWLLDVNLPDGNGYTLCEHSGDTPVIFITANDTEEDFLKGFESGCDDYIAKPFSVEVLRQKVLAMTRRIGKKTNNVKYLDFCIDYDKKTVTVRDEAVKLTATEYRLLEYMVKNRGKVLTREILLTEVWDSMCKDYVDDNTLSVQIRRLRAKIETDSNKPEYIVTVFGMGYTFGR